MNQLSRPALSCDLRFCPVCGARIESPFQLVLAFSDSNSGYFFALDGDEDPPENATVHIVCGNCNLRSQLKAIAYTAGAFSDYGLRRLIGGMLENNTSTH